MWRKCICSLRSAAPWTLTFPLLTHNSRPSNFQPFSSKDENDLVQMVTTRPRHVLKYVRQQVWKSRKKELQFRNSVTHIMIVLQEHLRKEMIDPTIASSIMEGILEECVTYSQHDMAHLLFRAFLRFRKYGCQISVTAVRHLFESYKTTDSKDLILQLADEMKDDPSLRALCIAAYLFAGKETEAEALRNGVPVSDLPQEDVFALVEGYAKLSNGEKVKSLIKEAANGVLKGEDASILYDRALLALSRCPDQSHFEDVLQDAIEKNIVLQQETLLTVLKHRMNGVTSSEDIQKEEMALIDMGYSPSIAGGSVIISAYVRLIQFGDQGSEELMLSKVDTLLSSIQSRLQESDEDTDISAAHIRAVIRGYGAAGKPEEMKKAWEKIKSASVARDVRVCNELLKWFSLMGNIKEVLAIKKEMEELSIHLDIISYTWIFRVLGKFYPRHVSELYDEIVDKGIRPDIHLYNTLLGIFGDLGQMDKVKSIQADMHKRHESGTLEYTSITFAILIRLYQKDVATAESLYQEAKKFNLHNHQHVLTSMLHVLASRSSEEKLQDFLSSLGEWSTDVFNVLLNKYGREKNVEKFNDTLDRMKKEDIPMNDVTFGTLVTAFARWGDGEKINEVVQLLKDHEGEVSAVFYSVLASSLSRLGKSQGVDEAWENLLSSKLFPDTEVYNQFLALYSRHHNVEKMQNVLNNMMKQVPPNPVTATTVLDMLGKTGHVAEMEDLFQDMKETPDTQPTAVTFHQMMNAYAKSGDVMKMETIHEEFERQGYQANAVTYNILMEGYGRAKRFEQMKELFSKREQNNIPVDDRCYCIMITSFGRSRLSEEVHRLFDDVRMPEKNHLLTKRVLWCLMDAFCRCRESQSIDRCVELMKAASPTNDLAPHEKMKLISFFCRLGDMEKAEDMLARRNDLGESSSGGVEEVTYSAANALARGYARVGRFEKTVEWLHYLRDKNWAPDPSTALQLSTAFLNAGLHDQAKQILEWRRQYVKHSAGEETGARAVPSHSFIFYGRFHFTALYGCFNHYSGSGSCGVLHLMIRMKKKEETYKREGGVI
eukprot:gene12503-8559_t